MGKIRPEHNHAEAFCHMEYQGQARCGMMQKIVIWNSRDGVTPFTCNLLGIQLTHNNWHQDIYDPNYKPKKGEYIWISWDTVSAEIYAEQRWVKHVTQYEQEKTMTPEELDKKHGGDYVKFNMFGQLEAMIQDGKEEYIKGVVRGLVSAHGEPQPRLMLVEEDWP